MISRKKLLDLTVTEDKLKQQYGFTTDQLEKLRRSEKFPYIKISRTHRIYFLPAVFDWILERNINFISEPYRKILGLPSDDSVGPF
jgi:hypothetical protein